MVHKIIFLIDSSGERICELHIEHIKMREISNCWPWRSKVGVGNDPSQRSSFVKAVLATQEGITLMTRGHFHKAGLTNSESKSEL